VLAKSHRPPQPSCSSPRLVRERTRARCSSAGQDADVGGRRRVESCVGPCRLRRCRSQSHRSQRGTVPRLTRSRSAWQWAAPDKGEAMRMSLSRARNQKRVNSTGEDCTGICRMLRVQFFRIALLKPAPADARGRRLHFRVHARQPRRYCPHCRR
jgi:hypothetical protein